jgi:hypothetical protein
VDAETVKAGREAAGDASRPAGKPAEADLVLGGSSHRMGKDRSTARHGDLSVAEIERRREIRLSAEALERQTRIQRLIERGRGCEEAGKFGAAGIYYKQAARQADSPLREQLLERARQLQR